MWEAFWKGKYNNSSLSHEFLLSKFDCLPRHLIKSLIWLFVCDKSTPGILTAMVQIHSVSVWKSYQHEASLFSKLILPLSNRMIANVLHFPIEPLAPFRNKVCTIGLPTHISVFIDEPDIVVPNWKMKSKWSLLQWSSTNLEFESSLNHSFLLKSSLWDRKFSITKEAVM